MEDVIMVSGSTDRRPKLDAYKKPSPIIEIKIPALLLPGFVS